MSGKADHHFHWADYVIFIGFLCISMGIGVYHSCTGGKQRTTGEFIMANRKLSVIPTVLSMVLSYMSAIMIVGTTAEIYSYGSMHAVYFLVGYCLSALFLERVVVPWIYKLRLISIFDYLERRFQSRAVRLYGAFVGILHAILYNGVAMFAPSTALESVTGLSVYVSLPLLAVVGTTYTALGGMRAVIWTDVFQSIIMIAGMLAILIKGLVLVGGLGEVFRVAHDSGRLIYDEFSPDPRERNTFWTVTLGVFFGVLFVKGFCQASVQRYSATTSVVKARRTIYGNVILSIFMYSVACLTGFTVISYFAKSGCDPILSGKVTTSNQLLPVFVTLTFSGNKGFSGLFIATLYSGALSSLSSNLSGSAANIWEDLLKWKFGSKLSELRAAQLNKALVVLVGILSLGVSFLANAMPGPVGQVSGIFFGGCGGPMVGIFLLGGLFRWTNWIGCLVGGICGLLFNVIISVGSIMVPGYTKMLPPTGIEGCSNLNSSYLDTLYGMASNFSQPDGFATFEDDTQSGPLLKPLYQTSFHLYGMTGCLSTLLIGMIVSLVTNKLFPSVQKENSMIEDKYFIDWGTCCTFRGDDSDNVADDMLNDLPKEREMQHMEEYKSGKDVTKTLLREENGFQHMDKV